MMRIVEWIKSINGASSSSNTIERLNALRNKIYRCLGDLSGKESIDFRNCNLYIQIEDAALFSAITQTQDFEDNLKQYLDSFDICFYSIRFEEYRRNIVYNEIESGISYGIEVKPQVQEARIYVYKNQGSLCKDCYILNPEEMRKNNMDRFNIGGYTSHCMLPRRNDIAINYDDSNVDQKERNKYVSRQHAHIKYQDHMGFMLYVDERGTAMAGKGTEIWRGNKKPIELHNIASPQLLLDGDCIVLSRHVVLEYKITKYKNN